MKISNSIWNIFALIMLIGLIVQPSPAKPIDAYGGFVSSDQVNEGDEVRFSGTFHNFGDAAIFIFSLNITFVEKLGVNAIRDPERPNITKVYDQNRREISINASFTDSITNTIDFSPGAYNVSIFFSYSNSSTTGSFSSLPRAYALANSSFVVEGVTRTLEVVRTIGIVIGAVGIIVIGVVIYNAKFKNKF